MCDVLPMHVNLYKYIHASLVSIYLLASALYSASISEHTLHNIICKHAQAVFRAVWTFLSLNRE